jgi:hypothetical protein
MDRRARLVKEQGEEAGRRGAACVLLSTHAPVEPTVDRMHGSAHESSFVEASIAHWHPIQCLLIRESLIG